MTCTLRTFACRKSLSQLPTPTPADPQQAVEQLLPHERSSWAGTSTSTTPSTASTGGKLPRHGVRLGVSGDGERVLVLGSAFSPTEP